MAESDVPQRSMSRRAVLGVLGVGALAGLAGCSGGDTDPNGDGGSPGATETPDASDTSESGGSGADGSGGGQPTAGVSGLELTEGDNGRLVFSRSGDADVYGVRLHAPDGTQLYDRTVADGYALFPGRGGDAATTPSGEYTLETVDSRGNVLDSDTLSLERSFDVVDARYNPEGGGSGYSVAFDVENNGHLPIAFRLVRVTSASEIDGYEQVPEQGNVPDGEPDDLVLSSRVEGVGATPGGVTRTVHGSFEFIFRNEAQAANPDTDETPSEPPCADWSVERTYELVGAGDYGATVDVTVTLDGAVDNLAPEYRCRSGEVVEFSTA